MAMLPALYAHRLGRAYGPDSSAKALAGALRRPVDGLETDCCLTADGELVLLHDPLLEVGTTVSGWAQSAPRRRSARAGSATRMALQATSARCCSTSCSNSHRPARRFSSRSRRTPTQSSHATLPELSASAFATTRRGRGPR